MNEDPPLRCHDRLVLWSVAAIGLLATVLAWTAGWAAGVPTTLVWAVLLFRAQHAGFRFDAHGLTVGSFFPGRDRQLPWTQIKGLNIDHVQVGSDEGRATRPRMRVFVEDGDTPQVIGFSDTFADGVTARFVARGLPTSDG